MFGYIKPLEPELRVRERDAYRAVYCGLCRGLAEHFGPLARFTLSYDFTFAAMLHASLRAEAPVLAPRRCPFNPLNKRPHLEMGDSVSFGCDTAMLLLAGKVRDNIADASLLPSLPWRATLPLLRRGVRDAGLRQPEAAAIAERLTLRQAEVESGRPPVDLACDPTAEALGGLFALMSEDAAVSRVLTRLGYMLGRFVYLCDAIDDYEDDLSDGSFNPLRDHPGADLPGMLNLTISEARAAYALLEPRYFKEILDNILFLGLAHTADRLIAERSNHEQSV